MKEKRLLEAIKEESMEDKEWWKSVTIWMQIVGTLSFLLKLSGFVELTPETQATLAQNLAAIATSLAILIGAIVTVVRRFKKDAKPIARKVI
jgi:hypothetical protein